MKKIDFIIYLRIPHKTGILTSQLRDLIICFKIFNTVKLWNYFIVIIVNCFYQAVLKYLCSLVRDNDFFLYYDIQINIQRTNINWFKRMITSTECWYSSVNLVIHKRSFPFDSILLHESPRVRKVCYTEVLFPF